MSRNRNSISRGVVRIINRYQAKEASFTRYFTGKPCKNGHLAERYVNNGSCVACVADRVKVKYAAGWRQNYSNRAAINRNWNASDKARQAKARWKDRDPKRAWAVYAVGAAKIRARLKGIPFDITSEYIREITPDHCPVFGTPFAFTGNGSMLPHSASLDRLDPSNGYVQGNVAVISVKANSIKSAYSSCDIQKVANWLREAGY